jgi:hypothetical protein
VAGQDRQPDVQGVQRPHLLQDEADAPRQLDVVALLFLLFLGASNPVFPHFLAMHRRVIRFRKCRGD